MKIFLLLGGFLLITFGERAESRAFSNWQDKLSADLDRMHQQLEAEAKRREEQAEAREKRLEAAANRREMEAEAREERLEAAAKRREKEAEAREKRLEAAAKRREEEAEAREKKFQAELNVLRQKCAKKGFPNDAGDQSNSMVTFTNSINGFRHIYVQTYNPTTKKVSGSYYQINENDPNAEPICGKLNIESTS